MCTFRKFILDLSGRRRFDCMVNFDRKIVIIDISLAVRIQKIRTRSNCTSEFFYTIRNELSHVFHAKNS